MKKYFPLFLLFLFLIACQNDEKKAVDTKFKHNLTFKPGQEDAIRKALITIEDHTSILLTAGNYHFEKLSILGKLKNIQFAGEGSDKTIIDFSNQEGGGEGMRVDDIEDFTIKGIRLQESKGDLLKINQSVNVNIIDVHTVWEGEPDINNGGYGIYPVLCKNVLIDNCYTRGASDAGVYVGQTIGAIIKNSKAELNVAGFEIENTKGAEAFNNEAWNNTGGFLIFDHPGLKHDGGNIKVYNNNIHDNNYKNFAPAANSASGVGNLPPGTGILVLRTSNVEVYDNIINNNNTMALGIWSYITADPNIQKNSPNFDPFPKNVSIKNNTITKKETFPATVEGHDIAQVIVQAHSNLAAAGLKGGIPEILYDGIKMTNEANPYHICIGKNGTARFLNLDIGNNFQNPSFDATPYACD